MVQGSTETTLYVLAVYFGAVGIRRTHHALGCGLAADAAGIVAAILVSYLFIGRDPRAGAVATTPGDGGRDPVP